MYEAKLCFCEVISFVMEIVLFLSTVVTALPKKMLFQLTFAF